MLVIAIGALRGIGIFAVSAASFLPTGAAAQGLPVDTGSHMPVALWFIGALVLGCVLVYGIVRNSRRSRAEKQQTDQATRENYRREGRNREQV